jgi:hypothetical protein
VLTLWFDKQRSQLRLAQVLNVMIRFTFVQKIHQIAKKTIKVVMIRSKCDQNQFCSKEQRNDLAKNFTRFSGLLATMRLLIQGKITMGSYESTFHPDVDNAIVKRVLDLEFLLFVLTNCVLKLAFGMHKRLLRDNLA